MWKTRGFSYLEMMVALSLFGIAVTGTTRLVVMQSRQMSQVERRLNYGETSYLVPSNDAWARKLGAAATIQSFAPDPPPLPPVTLIDDGDPGYSETGSDWHNHGEGYLDNIRHNKEDNDLETASWEFTDLRPREYKVFATWTDRGDPDAPFTIYDDLDVEGTVTVDMAEDPSGSAFGSVPWESLGTFYITSGTLRVELSNVNGHIVADAVRIVPVGYEVDVLSVQKPLDSQEVTIRVSLTPLE